MFRNPRYGEIQAELAEPEEIKAPGVFHVGRDDVMQELVDRKGPMYEVLKKAPAINVLLYRTDGRSTDLITDALSAMIAETSKHEFSVSSTCDCGVLSGTGFRLNMQESKIVH